MVYRIFLAGMLLEGPLYFFRETDVIGAIFSRETWFKVLFIRDCPSPDNFYVHVKAVLELSVTCERTFELNVIRELP